MKENKKSVILFAGTTEGRQLAEYLQELDRPFVICVATGYGRDLLEDICRPDRTGCMEIRQGRLDVTEMEQMFDELRPELVIDATHPYAAEVTFLSDISRPEPLFQTKGPAAFKVPA